MSNESKGNASAVHPSIQPLFTPFSIGKLTLPNRIVMAPMTRTFSPNGMPGADVAQYYRRRAENGVGLIITEGNGHQPSLVS
jgi:2,4-dienoyl-CoA reductase-like NADH-dependent reductase (Old Yellow Enzyme family)